MVRKAFDLNAIGKSALLQEQMHSDVDDKKIN